MDRVQHSAGTWRRQQRGAVLLITLMLVGLLATIFVVILVNDLVRENQRQRQTSEALAKAKEALIGFAAGVNLPVVCPSPPSENDCIRPGDLPCPDLDDDGQADPPCGNSSGSTGQDRRVGRLPWYTLGLPDLRDGDGERLWYAVSNNFKNNQRTQCDSPSAPGCLNSSTVGTITLRDRSGNVVNDGTNPGLPSGAVAIVISPGGALTRDGAANSQERSCAGGSCNPAGDVTGICTSSPPTTTAKCNPLNYLDTVNGGEDNANFVDGGTNGFVNGPVFAADGHKIVNDTILAIQYSDLMPVLERRVAQEALNCLNAYANYPAPSDPPPHQRYPWAASVATSTGNTYVGERNFRFGRLPDTFGASLLGILPSTAPNTLGSVVADVCNLVPALCMSNGWPASSSSACKIPAGGWAWWANWKDSVFYGVAPDYAPEAPNPLESLTNLLTQQLLNLLGLGPLFERHTTPAPCGSPGTCLTVNPPSATVGRKVVVAVAGRPLAGQLRASITDRQNIANYLEGSNASNLGGATPPAFTSLPRSTTFNDFLLYQ